MKKLFAAIAAGLVALALSACGTSGVTGTTGQSSAASNAVAKATAILANLQTVVVSACSVVQPTLESVGTLDASVSAAATANGLFCTTAAAITVTSAQTLLDTGIPAVISAVNASTFIPAAQKPIFVAALSLFELTVKNAISAYNSALATVAAPAATLSTASAPVAASQ
ncbi:hypothetical protein [Paraburkholderia bannensis]|uniref:hypothetical protein n=1 Tax=Paraburkholderia bannensis TaxID=765414 RepID=UPI002ABDBDA2|nr:hypothetical protein [Paraburkholderia bannensis]